MAILILPAIFVCLWLATRQTPAGIARECHASIQRGDWEIVWRLSAGRARKNPIYGTGQYALLARTLATSAGLGALKSLKEPPRQDANQHQYWLEFERGRVPLRIVRAREGWLIADSSLIMALARSLPGDRAKRHALLARDMKVCGVNQIRDSVQGATMTLADIERAGRGDLAYASWTKK
ncbi:MAG TPA: hypothetical protein VGE01_06285 [Fimbriimonas sp.]